ADFYQMQGRPSESERYLRRTVEIREPMPGLEDEFARALQDLARNLLLQGKLTAAETESKHALAIVETKYGAKALELFPAMTLISQIYLALSNWTQAELLMLRAISIREAASG